MDPTYAYLACLIVLAVLAASVVLFLRRPVEALLTELCGSELRGLFWARTYYAALFLGTLFAALLAPPESSAGSIGLLEAIGTLRYGFLGLLASLGVLSLVVMKFILRALDTRPVPSLPQLKSPLEPLRPPPGAGTS